MAWRALATDFDGTLASEGVVPEQTLEALQALRDSGRKVVLVTGRELPDFEPLHLSLQSFDLIVAENGALLHDPWTGETIGLGEPPPPRFVEEMRHRGAMPVSAGVSIIATVEPYEQIAIELIREMGLEHQVIFNKGAVMILPPGVNKASGLRVALERLRIDPAEVVAAGDAENDHALLEMCGLPVAVANAIPSLKEKARWVTPKPNGAGMAELIDALCSGGLDRDFARPTIA